MFFCFWWSEHLSIWATEHLGIPGWRWCVGQAAIISDRVIRCASQLPCANITVWIIISFIGNNIWLISLRRSAKLQYWQQLRVPEVYMVIFYLPPLVQYQNDKWSSSSGWLLGNNLRDLKLYNPRVQKKVRIAKWRNFTFGRLSIDTDATSKRVLNAFV